jgi:phosphoglycolate phosphatase-like HAD superfamily hydrolase
MRAKTVPIKAYIFDFDDTLVKTDAKIHIYKDGRRIKSITPEEYNNYKLQKGETQDVRDFVDPRIIMKARPFKMWPALRNIDSARKMGRSSSDIFILTARSPAARVPIHNFLTKNGIDIPLENVITIGFDDGRPHDAAKAKEEVIRELKDRYPDIMFYDDSEKNIELVSKIGGIKTRLVDWNK